MKTGSVCGSFWRNIKRFGTAEKNENKEGKWCILTVFETIWYCRDHFETRTLSRVLWHFLKRYLKLQWEKQHMCWLHQGVWSRLPAIRELLKIGAFWRYLKQYFGITENMLKTRKVNGAFCRYLIQCHEICKAKWCILTRLETYARRLLGGARAGCLKRAFWHYLKLFGTAEKHLKTKTLFKTCILTLFETIWNCRETFENKNVIYLTCILTLFETIWICR